MTAAYCKRLLSHNSTWFTKDHLTKCFNEKVTVFECCLERTKEVNVAYNHIVDKHSKNLRAFNDLKRSCQETEEERKRRKELEPQIISEGYELGDIVNFLKTLRRNS